MTIDQMMAEIRRDHPDAEIRQRKSGLTSVRVSGKAISLGGTKYDAVDMAYRAVRKARPKPMTVAGAKAFVLERKPKARWGARWIDEDYCYFIWDGIVYHPTEPATPIGIGKTECQAWKAAAAAIAASDKEGKA